ncbi:uncharacterized protein LOC34619907 [Cyclospora cayetanensis]|uniref:histidine--tRNA ligase n=1 Tax=Cyclospora cayetanensis TaxID=88456 RepID=A0A6P6RYL3_9EIME|nr:uncharacterized protein LOC34619907 [Cyclospora cayetanensis]
MGGLVGAVDSAHGRRKEADEADSNDGFYSAISPAVGATGEKACASPWPEGHALLPPERDEAPVGSGVSSFLPPRGFRDFPPAEFATHRWLFSLWHQVAAEFGFQEYKGPSVERASLYAHFVEVSAGARQGAPSGAAAAASHTRGPTPLADKSSAAPTGGTHLQAPPHIYRLQGKPGRDDLCLRPELTPSLSRMLLREQQGRPSGAARRWYSVERVWRHERPGCGRRREHFQWNLDIAMIPSFLPAALAGPLGTGRGGGGFPSVATSARAAGVKVQECGNHGSQKQQPVRGAWLQDFSSFAVAELIAAAVRLFQKLGLTPRDVKIRVGSRGLLADLLMTDDALSRITGNQGAPRSSGAAHLRLPEEFARAVRDSHVVFQKRLISAMQVLDRAGRRGDAAETEAALSGALGISAESSAHLLKRLVSFNVQDDDLAQKLARRMRQILPSDSNAICMDSGPTESSQGPLEAVQEVPPSVRELRRLLHLLDEGYQIMEWVEVDLLIVRGLHYYTGIVFEAFDTANAFRAVLGGGTYGVYGGPLADPKLRIGASSVGSLSPQEAKAEASCVGNARKQTVGSITGVGLGMGDCVLLELLKSKGLVRTSRPTVDIVVALRQEIPARRLIRAASRSEAGAKCGIAGSPAVEGDRSPTATSLPSAGAPCALATQAQALCCKLRGLGFSVELMLPLQRPDQASIRHAKAMNAKAIVFVSAADASRCRHACEDSAAEQVPSTPFEDESVETVDEVEFDVVLLATSGDSSSAHHQVCQRKLQAPAAPSANLKNPFVKSNETLHSVSCVVSLMERLLSRHQ